MDHNSGVMKANHEVNSLKISHNILVLYNKYSLPSHLFLKYKTRDTQGREV